MKVGEKNVDAAPVAGEKVAHSPQATTSVQRDERLFRFDHHAGGVAAVANRLRTRRRQRTTRTKDCDLHEPGGSAPASISQKTAKAPSLRPPCPWIGTAVT